MNEQTIKKILPRQGHTYTLRQILCVLALDDSPSLGFFYKGREAVIQHRHITHEQLLKVPGFANSCWKYIRTTNEWIPVFEFADADIEPFVNIEPEYDFDSTHTENFWVTPRGHYLKQYYAPKGMRSKNNNMFVFNSYWQTWSRILQEGTAQNGFVSIEVDVTPVNPTRPESWQRQIPKVNVRKHSTERSKRDKFVGTLPHEVVVELNKHITPEVQQLILHEDLLPQIDWELYRKNNNGGAAFDSIRKK